MVYLGTVTGGSGAYSNQRTGASGGAPFALPTGLRAVYLAPQASGIFAEIHGQSYASGDGKGAQLAWSASGLQLIHGPFKVPPGPNPTEP